MRKFKVVKKWPGGPEIGSVWEAMDGYISRGTTIRPVSFEECDGYVEEIKEPEEFWFIDLAGEVKEGKPFVFYGGNEGIKKIPTWLRFRTKDSAEKFAKALKDSQKLEGIEWGESNSGTFYIQEKGIHDGRAEMEDLIDALNDRVK